MPLPKLIEPTRSQGIVGEGLLATLLSGTLGSSQLDWFSRDKGGNLSFELDYYPSLADEANRNMPRATHLVHMFGVGPALEARASSGDPRVDR